MQAVKERGIVMEAELFSDHLTTHAIAKWWWWLSPQHYLGDQWPGWQLVSPDARDAGMDVDRAVPAMDTFQSRINIGSHSDLSILTCSDMLWKCQGWTQSQALTLHLTVKLLAPTRESWVAWLRTPSICIHVSAYGLPQRSPAYCQLASSKGQGDTISLLLPLRGPPL